MKCRIQDLFQKMFGPRLLCLQLNWEGYRKKTAIDVIRGRVQVCSQTLLKLDFGNRIGWEVLLLLTARVSSKLLLLVFVGTSFESFVLDFGIEEEERWIWKTCSGLNKWVDWHFSRSGRQGIYNRMNHKCWKNDQICWPALILQEL